MYFWKTEYLEQCSVQFDEADSLISKSIILGLTLKFPWFYKTSAPQKLVLNRLNSAKISQIHRFTLAKDYLLYVFT